MAKNGLVYENLTLLNDNYIVLEKSKYNASVEFRKNETFIKVNKRGLFHYMKNKMDSTIKHAHGCKQPDECYVNERSKVIFIIEKKFQQTPGSTCEKIQTVDFKLFQYKCLFPNYKVVYIYCLSNWFKTNCIRELEYLNFMKVPYFFGEDKDYKQQIINFLHNYK